MTKGQRRNEFRRQVRRVANDAVRRDGGRGVIDAVEPKSERH